MMVQFVSLPLAMATTSSFELWTVNDAASYSDSVLPAQKAAAVVKHSFLGHWLGLGVGVGWHLCTRSTSGRGLCGSLTEARHQRSTRTLSHC